MKHQEAFCIMRQEIHNNAVYFARVILLHSLGIVLDQYKNIALQQIF